MILRSARYAPPGAPTGRIPDPDGHPDEVRHEALSQAMVVARRLDGQLLKGFALNFRPSKETFLLRPRAAVDPETTTPVRLADLKALFFVKDFDGDPSYQESTDAARPMLLTKRVRVRFRDGEVLRGTTPSGDLGGVGFFVIPMDPRSNNRRIYVVTINVIECRFER